MKTSPPTLQDIDRLLAFLPILSAKARESAEKPVKDWVMNNPDGSLHSPYPIYEKVIQDLYAVASRVCRTETNYDPGDTQKMLDNEQAVKTATFAQIRAMLTFCVRSERFCDGAWGAMVCKGKIQRLLQRLAELRAEL